uniref:Uncharacterized protein n=1 Tax=Burkholderia sp. (strain CCGE1003) TaxID=640512 RepID=E1TJ72_BURSG
MNSPGNAHLEAKQLIADEIRSMFPDGAEFHSLNPRNFFVLWPLHGQPEGRTQWSRSISIYFSDQFLEAIVALSDEARRPYIEELRRIITQRMAGFDEGRAVPYGQVKDALIIDVAQDLAI